MIALSVLGISSRSIRPDGRRIISDVRFRAEPGSLTAIVGPSGAGKSTLLDLVTGIEVPATGSVLLGDTRMHPATDSGRARLRARVFAAARQGDDLIDALSVDDNVLLGQRLARRIDRSFAERVCAALNLDRDVRRTPVQHLSGGQRRRVALARACASGTAMLACDEPTTALDDSHAGLVRGVLRSAVSSGRTVVAVTHDFQLAADADRIVQLVDGRTTALLDRPTEQQVRRLMTAPS
ncbi:ABC transporter ATP-binding protein [Curtobacterium sp. MWU13-2055]|uniref:ABC transporter ATP-binding protein n=1 Tax=Curtobacterium sp. MWU13-2055 TaxID=2931928 RepID=UPI00200D7E77|nr:ATP-binding cassette domain-containing protein [Curtobacterium sp. MWU13-2055]